VRGRRPGHGDDRGEAQLAPEQKDRPRRPRRPQREPDLSTGERVLSYGISAVLVVVIMLVGSLVLWIGVPLFWLYIGSLVQGGTDSVGAAIGAALVGATVSIIGLAWVLARLNEFHQELQARRGDQPSPLLEMVLVAAAGIALVGFVFWFFFIEGPGPSVAPRK
jgi:hypothetical protein